MASRSRFVKVFVAAALLLSAFVSGCTSSSDGGLDLEEDDLSLEAAPVLYLNVTVGNETHRFSTAPATPVAGATGGNSSTTTVTSSNSSTATASGNPTQGNASKGNSTVGASTGELGGAAPLNVSVTLGASGLPAGTSVNWTLDFGDSAAKAGNATGNATGGNATAGNRTSAKAAGPANGTKVPATVDHTYSEAGNYTVSLSFQVGNGTKQMLRAPLTVTAGNETAGGLAPGTVIGPAPVLDGEGSFTYGLVVLCDEAASFDWVIPAVDEATGAPVALADLVVTLSGDDTNRDSDLEVYGPDGELIGSSTGGTSAETVSDAGPFPGGTFRVAVLSCAGVLGGFTVHGEGTLVAA